MKTCSKCSKEQELTEFCLRKETGNYRGVCRGCTNAASKARHTYTAKHLRACENKELAFQGKRKCGRCEETKELAEYYNSGKGTICKTCLHADYLKTREKQMAKAKQYYYSRTYGVTREELGSACEVCRTEVDLVIDHCHETGILRGLLCRQCNAAIGMLGDTAAKLRIALNYLEKPNEGKYTIRKGPASPGYPKYPGAKSGS